MFFHATEGVHGLYSTTSAHRKDVLGILQLVLQLVDVLLVGGDVLPTGDTVLTSAGFEYYSLLSGIWL